MHVGAVGMIDKALVIDEIQRINPSAGRDWLAIFDYTALRLYLDHLQLTLEPRGRSSVWRRRGETSAIVTRRPAA
jgi:hypothetical protein